jgi:glucose-6-phosphate-specific signal transduction histidine kinase
MMMQQRLSVECHENDKDIPNNNKDFNSCNTFKLSNFVKILQSLFERHINNLTAQSYMSPTPVLREIPDMSVCLQNSFHEKNKTNEQCSQDMDQIDSGKNQSHQLDKRCQAPSFDDFKLIKAVKSEISRLCCSCSAITSRIYIADYQLRFHREFEISLFKIIKMALSNIEKHACATKIAFTCGISESNELIMDVWDNGKGVPLDKLHDPSSAGLNTMRSIATAIGAKLDIIPMVKAGTLVVITIPGNTWKSQIYFGTNHVV